VSESTPTNPTKSYLVLFYRVFLSVKRRSRQKKTGSKIDPAFVFSNLYKSTAVPVAPVASRRLDCDTVPRP